MEHDYIEHISDADYRNVMMDFSTLPESAAFMPAVFETQQETISTAEIIRDLLA